MERTVPQLTLWLVRHGQSTVNAGAKADIDAPLTELGRTQAGTLAASFERQPDKVITSPLLRARQTAEPLLERWPGVPHEVWPIEEYAYLSPSRCAGSTSQTRLPWVTAYWQRNDPLFAEAEDAESFAGFMARVNAFHRRLTAQKAGFIVVFGHGQFLRAYQLALAHGFGASARDMSRFRAQEVAHPMSNTEVLDLSHEFMAQAGG